MEGEGKEGGVREEGEKGRKDNADESEQMGFHEQGIQDSSQREYGVSKLQTLNPTNPLRNVFQGASRVPTPSPSQPPLSTSRVSEIDREIAKILAHFISY